MKAVRNQWLGAGKNIFWVSLYAVLFALSSSSYAQQSGKIPRVGILGSVSASGSATRVEALRAGLRDLGYAEGKNIVFEFRWAETNYDRLPELAPELARLNVDVLMPMGYREALRPSARARRFRLS